MDQTADVDMILVHIGDGQVLLDHLVDFGFHLAEIDLGRMPGEGEDEAVLHVIMTAAGQILGGEQRFAQILSGMAHEAVGQGLIDDVHNFLGFGTKDGGAGQNHFFAHADQKVGIETQQGIDQIEVFHDHALSAAYGLGDGISQIIHLGETVFETDVQMVGVGGKHTEASAHFQNRQGANIHAVIVVGQLQTGEHTADEGALAGTCVANDANELVGRGQILLHQLHTQREHTLMSTGSEITAYAVAFLKILHSGASLFLSFMHLL